MDTLFFNLEFQNQPVGCFHNAYVNISHLSELAGASVEDFLEVPQTQERLQLLTFCLRPGDILTIQIRRPIPRIETGLENRGGSGDELSDLWAHYAFAHEFLYWHGDRALCEWFIGKCLELYWREDFDDLRCALSRRVSHFMEALHQLSKLDPTRSESANHCLSLAITVMSQLDADIHVDHDVDELDQFGGVSPGVLREFWELTAMVEVIFSEI